MLYDKEGKKINHEETYPKVVFKINKEFRHSPRKNKKHASNHILYTERKQFYK